MTMFERIGSTNGVTLVLSNIGNIHMSMGAFTDALAIYEKTLAAFEASHSMVGIANTQLNMGNLYRYTGSYPEALECYDRAGEMYELLGNRHGLAAVQLNIGSTHGALENFDQSMAFLERARTLFEEINSDWFWWIWDASTKHARCSTALQRRPALCRCRYAPAAAPPGPGTQ